MNILITGGTVFVSRYTAEYFSGKGHKVFVLNRNSRPQVKGVELINRDRHNLQNDLKAYSFDAVIDIAAYNRSDVEHLLDALGSFCNYVLISSSAVYPETLPQPFKEEQPLGVNSYWGNYGTDKIAAEEYLLSKVPQAYILRPPYLYGRMNNLYREAFVFDCAHKDMPFFIPRDGKMPLHFFDIGDLCRFIEIIIEKQPPYHIFNVGNPNPSDICEWVSLCYEVLGKTPHFRHITGDIPQRSYFPFYDYGYVLDVSRQKEYMPDVKPLSAGLFESYEWYKEHRELVRRKPLMEFIEKNLL